jgi:FAD synthase
MKTKQKTLAQLESQVYAFNQTYEVGFRVKLIKDDGKIEVHTLKSKAEVLSGHSAVAWFDGIRGCYSIDRVTQ